MHGVLLTTKKDLVLVKTTGLRITLNIDDTSITSRSHTHPSHSQASRLLTSSLSLGIPVLYRRSTTKGTGPARSRGNQPTRCPHIVDPDSDPPVEFLLCGLCEKGQQVVFATTSRERKLHQCRYCCTDTRGKEYPPEVSRP